MAQRDAGDFASNLRPYLIGGLIVLVLAVVLMALLTDGDTDPAPDAEALEEQQAADEVDSALKNTATAEESYLTSNPTYTDDVDALVSGEGLSYSPNVEILIEVEGGKRYCIQAFHSSLPDDHPWKVATYDSDRGVPDPEVDSC
jgi:hypothetical protein